MKYFFPIIFLVLLSFTLQAQNYSIANVIFDPIPPATLLPGEFINVTYNYSKTGGDIRIGVVPIKTSGNGSSGTSGYALITEDTGSGNGRFTYFNGAKIDSVMFQFIDLDWTVLYDTTIAVDFTFHDFNISNFTPIPAFPNILGIGDSIKFTFDYYQSYGNVRINPIALSNKEVIEGQIKSDSPVFSNDTGSVDGFIQINSNVYVDQILFQFLDATTNDTLIEIEKNVYYSFTDNINDQYSITNVVCNPPSPGIIKLNEDVNITFDYTKPFGDVRIYVDPVVSEGSYNFGTGGSPLYTENTGSGTGRFVFYDESKIEKLLIQIKSPSGIILHEYFEDVFFTVTADSTLHYSITDVELSPASPETLDVGDTLKVKFKYTKPFGDVYFFVRPLKNGELNAGFEVPTQGAFSNNIDSVESYIIYDIATNFDQIRIQMKTSLNRLLVEKVVDVDYQFKIPTNAETPGIYSEPTIYPIPASGEINISMPSGNFEYSVINLNGKVLLKGFSIANIKRINVSKFASGIHVIKINNGKKQFFKKIVFK